MRSARNVVIWLVVFVAFVLGFLLYDASGLITGGVLTPTTTVAVVNGRDVTYQVWSQYWQDALRREQQRTGQTMTLDEQRRLEDETFNRLVADLLLDEEVRRRGITASDEEVIQFARFAPPPWVQQREDLYTDGRFDYEKYQRYLQSPVVQQTGELAAIEQYIRTQLPKEKLFDQVASGVYLTDSRLWRIWQDEHDSASVSYVLLSPDGVTDEEVTVTDAEIRRFYDRHRDRMERQGRAVVSVLVLPRATTAADTAASRERALALRTEILGGASFADVARRESADTVSGAQGGDLGRGVRGRFATEFEQAAYALRTGEISQPVLSDFGFHLIRVDERRGDTLALRHILVPVRQSDEAAIMTDRRADSLSNLAGSADRPEPFDTAATRLGLTPVRATVVEGQPLFVGEQYVPSVSAWAFSGARPGESSGLFDSEDTYVLARLDSIQHGGRSELAEVRDQIREHLARQKKVEALMPRAQEIARAGSTTSLERAAEGAGLQVQRTTMFTRAGFVPGLGRLNQAVGASFSVPVGAVSQPVATDDGVFILRVERRVNADREAWEAQRDVQRAQMTQRMRQQRVEEFVANLRRAATVDDRRREMYAAARRVET